MNDFAFREVPRFGRRLFRMGLSGSFGLDEAGRGPCLIAARHLVKLF